MRQTIFLGLLFGAMNVLFTRRNKMHVLRNWTKSLRRPGQFRLDQVGKLIGYPGKRPSV
jgi:hypothetical protein